MGRSMIRVTTRAGSLEIPIARVRFTFATGRLGYDCVSCGFQCCRGHGYGLKPTELALQLRLRPALKVFVRADPRSTSTSEVHYLVDNHAPACHFLGANGACQVHAQFGYAAKPETCRLFPFNILRLIGGHLLIAPHMALCPLAISPSEHQASLSSHSLLLDELASGRSIGQTIPRFNLAPDDTVRLLNHEEEIVRLSESHLDGGRHKPFIEAQLELTREWSKGANGQPRSFGGSENSSTNSHPDLSWFESVCRGLLGAAPTNASEDDVELCRTMAAMTGTLRSDLLFPSPGTAPLPVDRIPFFLLGLHKLAALALEAGESRPTCQTVQRLRTRYHGLLWLLAWSDATMVWHPSADISMPRDESDMVESWMDLARTLLPAVQLRQPTALGTILVEHRHVATPGDTMSPDVWSRLVGRLMPLKDLKTIGVTAVGIRARAQRWALKSHSRKMLYWLAQSKTHHGEAKTSLTV